MRDAGGELAERGELLGLHQAILRGAQIVEGCGSSLVRACTSSNRRTFSMAITAWSAKVATSSICCSVNSSTTARVSNSAPIGFPSRKSGTPSTVRGYPLRLWALEIIVGISQNVGDMHDVAIESGPSGDRSPVQIQRVRQIYSVNSGGKP